MIRLIRLYVRLLLLSVNGYALVELIAAGAIAYGVYRAWAPGGAMVGGVLLLVIWWWEHAIAADVRREFGDGRRGPA